MLAFYINLQTFLSFLENYWRNLRKEQIKPEELSNTNKELAALLPMASQLYASLHLRCRSTVRKAHFLCYHKT